MAYDLEEQETLDALRDWWAQYGTLIVALAVAAAVAVLGWRGWQWYQGHQASQAMGYFEALETAAGQSGDESMARIKAASETLRSDFPASGYTSRGVLLAAHVLIERKDDDGAIEQLTWLIERGSDTTLKPLARLRLAGLLLERQDYDKALALLEESPAEFSALYADRKGDIFFAQGRAQDARQQWQRALDQLGADPLSQIVRLKLDGISGAES